MLRYSKYFLNGDKKPFVKYHNRIKFNYILQITYFQPNNPQDNISSIHMNEYTIMLYFVSLIVKVAKYS